MVEIPPGGFIPLLPGCPSSWGIANESLCRSQTSIGKWLIANRTQAMLLEKRRNLLRRIRSSASTNDNYQHASQNFIATEYLDPTTIVTNYLRLPPEQQCSSPATHTATFTAIQSCPIQLNRTRLPLIQYQRRKFVLAPEYPVPQTPPTGPYTAICSSRNKVRLHNIPR